MSLISDFKLKDWADVIAIISGVAVVASLYFVMVELDDNTTAVKAQNQRALINALQRLEYGRVSDPELAELLMRAKSGKSLSDVDRYRVESLVFLYLNNWEQALHDYRHGVMEEEIWGALDRWLTSKLSQRYFRETASEALGRNSYSELFEAHLKTALSATSAEDASASQ